MLTFNQLQEKKTKIKINPNVKDQYEHHKKDADGNTIPHEDLTEKKKPSVHDDYYDPMEDPTFDPHEAEATRGQSGRGTKGKMNTRKKYKVKEEVEGEELKEYSPNVSYQAKGGKKSGKLGKSSVYSLRDKDESKKEFRKSHTKDIKDGLLKKEGYQRDPEGSKKDRTHSKQPDPSKDGFTGIGNMSIKDIMKMNAKIKAKSKKEEVDYELEEERAARKMNVRTKGTIKKQIEKDAAAEAKRRAKKTGEYKETPKRKPKLKKPSQLTTVKAEPKKAKPKAKPVAAVKKVAPKPKAKPAAKKKAPAKKPAAKKVAPKKAAPKVDKKAADIDRPKGNLTDKARAWVKRGVKRHRKATQGARVFAKGAAKGAKDTVKFAGKVKKVFTGEGLMSFRSYLLSEDYHRGQGEKIQKRTKDWMVKRGEEGAPGLNAMKARTAEHKARRGVKKEEVEIDERTLSSYIPSDRQGEASAANREYVKAQLKKKEDQSTKNRGDLSKRDAGKMAKERLHTKKIMSMGEATRYKKEKGYDKGGTKKAPSPVMQAVIAKIEKEHGKGSIAGRTQQKKKVKGAKSTEGTGKYLKRAKEKAAYVAKAKKAGFKSTQAYTDTMARYGGESNYKKGKGLGT